MAFIVDSVPRHPWTPEVVTSVVVSVTQTSISVLTRNAEITARAYEVQGFTRAHGRSPYRLTRGDVVVSLTDH